MLRILPIALAIGLVALLYAGLERTKTTPVDHIPSPLIDKPAPQFALPTLSDPNRILATDDLLGTAYLLNVWGSWCPSCRDEHALITQIAESGEIPVYGLNWKDTRSEANRWLDMFGNPYVASLFDESGRLGIDFGVYRAPETFLIDAEGQIRFKHIGPLYPDVLQNQLRPAIQSL